MLKLVNPLLMTFATGFAVIATTFVIKRIDACAGTVDACTRPWGEQAVIIVFYLLAGTCVTAAVVCNLVREDKPTWKFNDR
ncbi:MAG TPA: hypothetical protein VFE15_13135 [Marmoricola sp.]|jgi:hypothetical protein|nr:hypothetical protein [Marmoricola sp.]